MLLPLSWRSCFDEPVLAGAASVLKQLVVVVTVVAGAGPGSRRCVYPPFSMHICQHFIAGLTLMCSARLPGFSENCVQVSRTPRPVCQAGAVGPRAEPRGALIPPDTRR